MKARSKLGSGWLRSVKSSLVVKNVCARSNESSNGLPRRHVAAQHLEVVGPEIRCRDPQAAARLARQRHVGQLERPLQRLLLGGDRHLQLVHDTRVLGLRRGALAEQEVAADLHLRGERLAGGVQRANVEDSIAGAGDLVLDVASIHLDDRDLHSVRLQRRAGRGPADAERFDARGQPKLHAAGDAAQRVRIGADKQTYGFRRPQPRAARRAEEARQGVALPAAGFDAQQLLAGERGHAIDEEPRPLAARSGVGNRAGERFDLELEAAVRDRGHAHGGEADAEWSLNLVDVLGEHGRCVVRSQRRRVDDRREDHGLRIDALGALRRPRTAVHPAEQAREDRGQQLVDRALEVGRQRAVDRELDRLPVAVGGEPYAIEQRTEARRRLRPPIARLLERPSPIVELLPHAGRVGGVEYEP